MIFFFRISFLRQIVIAFFFAAFGLEALQNAMQVRHAGSLFRAMAVLLALGCWWLAYRAIRVGIRVLTAHARVTFGSK